MASSLTGADFIVWDSAQTPHGPLALTTLISWVKDGRVEADTWIFVIRNSAWQKAAEMPELHVFFHSAGNGTPENGIVAAFRGVEPSALRRVQIFAAMSDEQLERFAQFMEVEKFPPRSLVVKQGEPGDTMYFILEGELRVCINVAGQETTLATLGAGEFFGDISLFDRGPRSADVVTGTESLLVKISSHSLDELGQEAPELATPFLRAIGKTLTERIRADNQRYGDSVKFVPPGR